MEFNCDIKQEFVGWQQRYLCPDEGPTIWQFCDDRSAEILKDRNDYELRKVYTDPSFEIERLRTELKAWMNAEAEKGIELVQLRQKLAEVQARVQLTANLLRDSKANLNQSGRLAKEIRRFIDDYEKSKRLSATSQPVESENHCPGDGVNPSKRPPEPTNFTPSAPGVTPPKENNHE